MIIDLSELKPGASLETEVCVIGAGAAGITLALELAARGRDVCVLESGGLVFEDAVQALSKGDNVGLPYFPLEISRMRFLGGSTNHWGGWCAPLSEIDFEQRDWVPDSGWPFSRESLLSYYQRAQELCELGPFRYQAAQWADAYRDFPHFDDAKVDTPCWQFSPPTLFGEVYREELAASPKIQLLLHAHVTGIPANDTNSAVQSVEISNLEGQRAQVKARAYVAACGGLENARLLLLSGWPDGPGLGNQHDLVGRYFMEHPHITAGTVAPAAPREFARTFTVFDRDDTHVVTGLGPSAAAQRREQILNCAATLVFKGDGFERGYQAYRELMRDVKEWQWPEKLTERVRTMMADLGDVKDGIARPEGEPYIGNVGWMGFFLRSEQAPNRNSRVMLGEELDPFGQPLGRLQWELLPDDKRTMRVSLQLIGEELGRLGLARLQIPEWLLDDDAPWEEGLKGGFHHMGTTRMALQPEQGVVDENCRVHEVANLYVAGSSVFPTGGFANPTLTLVALTVRLADYLDASLQGLERVQA